MLEEFTYLISSSQHVLFAGSLSLSGKQRHIVRGRQTSQHVLMLRDTCRAHTPKIYPSPTFYKNHSRVTLFKIVFTTSQRTRLRSINVLACSKANL